MEWCFLRDRIMKESWSLRFLYKTVPGRALLKILVQPGVSQMAGKLLSSKMSRCLIPYYIRKHNIDLGDIQIPEDGFSSFNDFFTRKRYIQCPYVAKGQLISPCDGFLTAVKINKHTCFEIKHTRYSLRELLRDEKLAKVFDGGTALIFRLTPANYHRYCYPVNGRIISSRKIEGKLHCVRPIALETLPVFIQNSREYQVIKSEAHGMIVQMEVGALLVGKIANHKEIIKGSVVRIGEEKGYFEFGGSTIILLFQKENVNLKECMCDEFKGNREIRVRLGESMER